MSIIKMNGKLYDAGYLLDLLIKKHNGLIVLITKKHNSLVDRVIVLENDFKKLNASFIELKYAKYFNKKNKSKMDWLK